MLSWNTRSLVAVPKNTLLMAGCKNYKKQSDSLYQISLTRKEKPRTQHNSAISISYSHHSTFGDVCSTAHKIKKGQFQSVFFLLVKHLVVTKHSGPCLVNFLSSNQKVFNPLTKESNIKVSASFGYKSGLSHTDIQNNNPSLLHRKLLIEQVILMKTKTANKRKQFRLLLEEKQCYFIVME